MNALILFLALASLLLIGRGIIVRSLRLVVTGGMWLVSAICLIYLAPILSAWIAHL